MKKSLSFSSINNNNGLLHQSMKKSTSMNALPIHNIEPNIATNSIEMLMFTNYPINKLVSCSVDNNKFPDQILDITNKPDVNYLECIITPSDIPETPAEKVNLSSTFSRSYLQLSIESSEQQERYSKWLSRIRRKK